jgi:hypothetical protein
LWVVFRCNLFDSPEFLSRKTSTSFEADWIKPNLRFAIITFHMYVRRFITVTGIEEESIRANSQNGRHQSFANRVSLEGRAGLHSDIFWTEQQYLSR